MDYRTSNGLYVKQFRMASAHVSVKRPFHIRLTSVARPLRVR